MRRLWSFVPVAISAAALALIVAQRAEIARLAARAAPAAPAARVAPAARSGPTTEETLSQRVAALEQTVSRLFKMLLDLDGRRATARRDAPAAAATEPAEVAALREDVDALLTGEALDSETGRKRLHEIVRQAQQQAWQEQRQRWQRFRREAQQSRLRELAQTAHLSPAQVEQLGGLLDTEHEQRHALFSGADQQHTGFAQLRQQMRVLRQTTDQQAQQLLDAAQFAAYQTMREERRGGPRWLR